MGSADESDLRIVVDFAARMLEAEPEDALYARLAEGLSRVIGADAAIGVSSYDSSRGHHTLRVLLGPAATVERMTAGSGKRTEARFADFPTGVRQSMAAGRLVRLTNGLAELAGESVSTESSSAAVPRPGDEEVHVVGGCHEGIGVGVCIVAPMPGMLARREPIECMTRLAAIAVARARHNGAPSDRDEGSIARVEEGSFEKSAVVERGLMEDALRQKQIQLQAILDYSPALISIKDLNGTIILANRIFAVLDAPPLNEFIGKNVFDVFPAPVAQALWDNDLAALKAGRPVYSEEVVKHKDGAWHTYYTVKFPIYQTLEEPFGICALSNDITERKRAEKALLESEERFRTIFEEAPLGVGLIDSLTGQIFEVNPRFAEIVGRTRAEMATIDWMSITHPDELQEDLNKMALLNAGKIPRFNANHRYIRPDGSYVWIAMTVAPVSVEDKSHPRHLCMIEDITERKRAEEEQQRLQIQVRHAQKLESLGVLAGGIAHDFNNILATILGNADLALDDIPEVSRARPCLEEIQVATRRANDLTRQMLAYSGKGRFEIRPVNLSELTAELGRLLKVSISKKTALVLRLAPDLPAVRADVAQLQQIVLNLIVNASESLAQEHGGVVTVSTDVGIFSQDYLDASRLPEKVPTGRYTYLEVADTGCGMDEATLERLFDPFFTTKFTGRGLGMSAVLGIVRGHKGAITVESGVGQGTTVRVLFPTLEGRAAVPLATESLLATTWEASENILFVDDEDSLRTLGVRMLERLGLAAMPASDGFEALEIFRKHADEIAAVVLDLSMPKMDGEQTLRELQKIRPDVRVILTSGYSESELEIRFAGRGVGAFLQKPFQRSTLQEKLNAVLKQQGSRTELVDAKPIRDPEHPLRKESGRP